MSAPGLVRKLRCLGYPIPAGGLSLEDADIFYLLILWLEEEKIRFLPQAERKKFRNYANSSEWLETFQKYCEELGVPSCGTASFNDTQQRVIVANRLASLAMQDIYLDLLESKDLQLNEDFRAEESTGRNASQEIQDLDHLMTQVNKLLEILNLPALPRRSMMTDNEAAGTLELDEDIEAVSAALKCVLTRVDPPECKQTHKLSLDLPVGFQPAKNLNAIVVLRLLHGNELRLLQDRLNEVVAQLQQITADPKTDSRLGRVGR